MFLSLYYESLTNSLMVFLLTPGSHLLFPSILSRSNFTNRALKPSQVLTSPRLPKTTNNYLPKWLQISSVSAPSFLKKEKRCSMYSSEDGNYPEPISLLSKPTTEAHLQWTFCFRSITGRSHIPSTLHSIFNIQTGLPSICLISLL
jgi:hypothetical protein